MSFQRWQCAWPRSWPYALFKKHHTELNHLYWSNVVAASHAVSSAAKGGHTDPIASILAVPAANAHRVNFTVGSWQGRFKEFENWTRLNALVALTGYLETYLYSIATLALMSDPGLLISSTQAVDGIVLVKRNALPDFTPHLTSLIKGEWSSRVNAYKRIFGHVPMIVTNSVTELDTMRKLRNGVGHSFGRMIDEYRNHLLMKPLKVQRLSEERLQKWLGIVEDCVNSIEEHLRINHVGAIEVLLNYHAWDKKYSAGHMTEERAFRARFPDAQGNPPPAEYFRTAISYYGAA
ncbi:MAG: hypothetical protein KA760_11465 [Steroidobacteraceae bacterium]|nr:hypothetical protein [Steroidobacteraceae bacterium]